MNIETANENQHWRDLDIVAFDTETTGKYPLTAEICELAAIKWRGGKVVDSFQTLLKPSKPMGAEVIAIHGITNDMVADAPYIREKIAAFHEFIKGAVVIAHHAPFDLGFVAIEFEENGLGLPTEAALCSSLLSRKLFPEAPNHRLQTLVGFFNLGKGQAHRALDDARACLEVGLRCLEKLGDVSLAPAFEAQGGRIGWDRFSMSALAASEPVATLIRAVRAESVVDMGYSAGSSPGAVRRVQPNGIVRSLDGDFVVAYDVKEQQSKRYFLEKVTSAVVV